MLSATHANPIDRHVGHRVRARRNEVSMQSGTLAAILGISQIELCRREAGRARFSAAQLFAITAALKAPIGAFFVGLG